MSSIRRQGEQGDGGEGEGKGTDERWPARYQEVGKEVRGLWVVPISWRTTGMRNVRKSGILGMESWEAL